MSDYLWDKSGEPDAEVERLEGLLGQLRHRPRAFEPPSDAPVRRAPRRLKRPLFFRPAFAEAAAAVLMLLAGLWLGLARLKHQDQRAVAGQSPPPQRVTPGLDANTVTQSGPDLNVSEKGGAPEEVAAARPGEVAKSKRRPISGSAAAPRRARGATAKNVDAGLALPARAGAPTGAGAGESGLMRTVARVGEERRRVKEELLYALRLTGSKLNLAQRKTLGDLSPAPARPREDF